MAGDVVGVVVGLEDVLDPDPVQAGQAPVGVDVPLRVDHRGVAGVAVGDEVGRAAEVLVDDLAEEHGLWCLRFGRLARKRRARRYSTCFSSRVTRLSRSSFSASRSSWPTLTLATLFFSFSSSADSAVIWVSSEPTRLFSFFSSCFAAFDGLGDLALDPPLVFFRQFVVFFLELFGGLDRPVQPGDFFLDLLGCFVDDLLLVDAFVVRRDRDHERDDGDRRERGDQDPEPGAGIANVVHGAQPNAAVGRQAERPMTARIEWQRPSPS